MGQSRCQSLSPSLVNLDSHWLLWEGQVFGAVSGEGGWVPINAERPPGPRKLLTSLKSPLHSVQGDLDRRPLTAGRNLLHFQALLWFQTPPTRQGLGSMGQCKMSAICPGLEWMMWRTSVRMSCAFEQLYSKCHLMSTLTLTFVQYW